MNSKIFGTLFAILALSALVAGCAPKEGEIKSEDAPKGASAAGIQGTSPAGAQQPNPTKAVAPVSPPQ